MTNLPRLRQVAIVAADLDSVGAQLQRTFGWDDPFHDPGVAEFGLRNSVFAAGDTFVEVVSPTRPGTTAGRYMDKRGGDSGYMAIFQVADLNAARKRIAEAGIRVVWQIDLPDMAGTHLHPKDVPGAIVSIDWAEPPETWRWGGPEWIGKAPGGQDGAIRSITVGVADPATTAERWASALDTVAEGGTVALGESGEPLIRLEAAGQWISFASGAEGLEAGITEVVLGGRDGVDTVIGGVRFRSEGSKEASRRG